MQLTFSSHWLSDLSALSCASIIGYRSRGLPCLHRCHAFRSWSAKVAAEALLLWSQDFQPAISSCRAAPASLYSFAVRPRAFFERRRVSFKFEWFVASLYSAVHAIQQSEHLVCWLYPQFLCFRLHLSWAGLKANKFRLLPLGDLVRAILRKLVQSWPWKWHVLAQTVSTPFALATVQAAWRGLAPVPATRLLSALPFHFLLRGRCLFWP